MKQNRFSFGLNYLTRSLAPVSGHLFHILELLRILFGQKATPIDPLPAPLVERQEPFLTNEILQRLHGQSNNCT